MPRVKQRTPELRDRLLRTAVATLAEAGIAGLTARRVAQGADTSVPAVYELFGDKAGLVREVYFEGFRLLRRQFETLPPEPDTRSALIAVMAGIRFFVRDNPVLAEVMFSRPFADFDPGPDELAATRGVREFIVDHVRRCIEGGELGGDPTDIAHVLLALAQGLAMQETAGWLGSTPTSVDRRWHLAFQSTLDGLRPVS